MLLVHLWRGLIGSRIDFYASWASQRRPHSVNSTLLHFVFDEILPCLGLFTCAPRVDVRSHCETFLSMTIRHRITIRGSLLSGTVGNSLTFVMVASRHYLDVQCSVLCELTIRCPIMLFYAKTSRNFRERFKASSKTLALPGRSVGAAAWRIVSSAHASFLVLSFGQCCGHVRAVCMLLLGSDPTLSPAPGG